MVFGQDNFIILDLIDPAERNKVVLPARFWIAFRKLDTLAVQMVHNPYVRSAAGDNLSVILNFALIYHNHSPVSVIGLLHDINCSA